MVNLIRLRKGLDIKLKGRAKKRTMPTKLSKEFALVPDDFVGVTPKMAVKAGDHVKAGEAIFVNKNSEEIRFASPVSGIVKEVVRGERRKILYVSIEADETQKP